MRTLFISEMRLSAKSPLQGSADAKDDYYDSHELAKRTKPIYKLVMAAVVVLLFAFTTMHFVQEHYANLRTLQASPKVEVNIQVITGEPGSLNPQSESASKITVEVVTPSRPDPGPDCLHTLPDEHYHGSHIVRPPSGPVTLVCCQSTKGTINIAVHPTWAPIGAARFLDMVESGFFSSKVPLFRALKGFLVQFGLAGDPSVQEVFDKKGNLVDDPSWLPLGPTGRIVNGVYRFQKGYMAYAGAGKDSRGTQLIMAFDRNAFLGGKPLRPT